MSYFIALKKVLDNTAFVVLSVLPATVMSEIKVHALLLGILETTDHLGHQCGPSVMRTPTCCLAKGPWHSPLQSFPWGWGFSSQGAGVHELQCSLYFLTVYTWLYVSVFIHLLTF